MKPDSFFLPPLGFFVSAVFLGPIRRAGDFPSFFEAVGQKWSLKEKEFEIKMCFFVFKMHEPGIPLDTDFPTSVVPERRERI